MRDGSMPAATSASSSSERSSIDSEFASLLVPNTASPQLCDSSHLQCAMKRWLSGERPALNGVTTGASTPRILLVIFSLEPMNIAETETSNPPTGGFAEANIAAPAARLPNFLPRLHHPQSAFHNPQFFSVLPSSFQLFERQHAAYALGHDLSIKLLTSNISIPNSSFVPAFNTLMSADETNSAIPARFALRTQTRFHHC